MQAHAAWSETSTRRHAHSMPIPPSRTIELDVLILGGGIAGLWTLNTLVEAGFNAGLVEATALGDGQSICAQGILHGGVKYSLSGLLSQGARQVAQMPQRWAQSLAGEVAPDLSSVAVRTRACHLWRTDSMKSIIGMAGAKLALQVRPKALDQEARPEVLKNCPGDVALLPELVLETPSLLKELAALHRGRILHGNVLRGDGTSEHAESPWAHIEIHGQADPLLIHSKQLVICAGAGSIGLLNTLGFAKASEKPQMQRRPLHMAMVKGPNDVLPELNGHCVDGAATRVTVTSSTAEDGNRVWQLGGELSETGCEREPDAHIEAARRCLASVLPGFNVEHDQLRWATYRIDRAEHCQANVTAKPIRPDDVFVERFDDTTVVWPTKMVLAPRAALKVLQLMKSPEGAGSPPFEGLPSPELAQPPWEVATWS